MEKIDFNLVYARYWTDEDYFEQRKKKSIKCAEVLVPGYIPYNYVVAAAVVNECAAEKLKLTGIDKKIVIQPGLFF